MLVVHIGLKKSGSTSIQSFLLANEEALRRKGFDFTRVGRLSRKAHHNLTREIRDHPKFDPSYGTLPELADYWREASGEVIILSAETFEDCEAAQAARLKAILRRTDEPVRVVLVLRDLLGLMPSSYAQKIKHGSNVYDFDAFFEQRIRERRVDYFETASRWADAFGWESLRVRVLDPRHLVGGDLIDDFMEILGARFDPSDVDPPKRPGQVNVAPGWRVLEAVRSLYSGRCRLAEGHPLARFAEHSKNRRKKVGERAIQVGETWGWNKDRGHYLNLDQARRCAEVYRASIESLNERLVEKLPAPGPLGESGFSARDFMPDASHIPPTELATFLDEVGG